MLIYKDNHYVNVYITSIWLTFMLSGFNFLQPVKEIKSRQLDKQTDGWLHSAYCLVTVTISAK